MMPSLPPRRRLVLTALSLVAARTLPARASTGRPVIIAGNGGALATMRALANAYMLANPDARIEFLPSLGTSGGIAAALDGAIGIALAARAPNERERAAGARSLPYARTPFAFAVHPAVRVSDVTVPTIVGIYSGETTHWPDGTLIRPVRRPHNDSATLTLSAMSPTMRQAVEVLQRRPGIVTAGTDQENAEALESVKGSFGPITLAQHRAEQRRLTLLSLDGVEPSVRATVAGAYPLQIGLHAVTGADPTPETMAFLAFLGRGASHDILAEMGHEPLAQDGLS